ncbi:NAD(P)-dependent oxidoreductase [Agrilactobacillus yilanensis]|uniref:NAD(P)-dependent oxidoreductase n=1 Tax=Agrilactobacillus yilanensis TaxID=2485997 RepID=A0ABW4J7P2_9LACO|nr:NAD(P)-dependent oxidoreductase [Agrilactobacillus yilanensis]
MSKTLLALKPFRPDQLTQLATQYPTLTVITPETLKPSDVDTINILYGYRQGTKRHSDLLNQLLASDSSQLQWIQSLSAGVDSLPFEALAAKHILVTTASGTHENSIAQNVLGYLLYFERGLQQAIQAQAQRHYGIDTTKVSNLDDKTILIFGTGHVGQKIAQIAAAFGMHVLGVSHSGRPKAGFETIATDQDYQPLLAKADYLVNIMPLTAETTHFFDKAFFDQLTTQPLFVNVGRGPSVDETALISALDKVQIKAAALDVFETEPLPLESPLWNYPNVLITPHTSGYVAHFKKAFFKIFEPNLAQFMKDGTLIRNQVDLSRRY